MQAVTPQAVVEAAQRFASGDVPNQSRTFAPSIAEFTQEARRMQEFLERQNRPRLVPPRYRPGPMAPFEMRRQKALADNAHLAVLFTDVSYDQWKRMSEQKQVPVGAKWVASLATVFGPAKSQSQAA